MDVEELLQTIHSFGHFGTDSWAGLLSVVQLRVISRVHICQHMLGEGVSCTEMELARVDLLTSLTHIADITPAVRMRH